MFNKKITLVIIGTIILFWQAFFIVQPGEQMILTEFGKLRSVYQKPGWYIKIPFYQTLTKYDKRMLDFEVPATELTLADQKRLVVDVFMRYRIIDPAKFYRTVRTEKRAQDRLSPLITGAMRNVLGTYGLTDILDVNRLKIMSDIQKTAQQITSALGIEIVEVRMSKTDFPIENSNAIYMRMISALKKEAQKWRGKGREEYLKRCAKADKESQEIISRGDQEAKETIGQADAERLEIYNRAYDKNPSFAKWLLDLEAVLHGLEAQKITFMLPEAVLR